MTLDPTQNVLADEHRLARLTLIRQYFGLSYIAVLVNSYPFIGGIELDGVVMSLFAVTVYLVYGLIYLIPFYLMTRFFMTGIGLYFRNGGSSKAMMRGVASIYCSAIVMTSLLQCLIYADKTLYSLYRMHFNGFVWNLVITPGGIASMGGDAASSFSYALIVLSFVLEQIVVLNVVFMWKGYRTSWINFFTRRRTIAVLTLVLVSMVGERLTFGIAHLKSYEPVLYAAQSFPFYNRTTVRSLAESLGVDVTRAEFEMRSSSSALKYPLKQLSQAY